MPSALVLAITVLLALLIGWWISRHVPEGPWRPALFAGRTMPVGVARIELTSPPDGAELRGPFTWTTDADVDRYFLELLDDQRRAFYRAEIREPEIDIPPIFFQLLVPRVRYTWRVYAVDRDGHRVAVSGLRTFIWRG